jgi:hypothetical protein
VAGGNTTDQDLAAALAQVDRDYPHWHAWPGVLGGLVYARRPLTSPPMVVRAVSVKQLRQEIEDAERGWGLR